jgi:hypothetical protein
VSIPSSQYQRVPYTIGWRQRLAQLQGSPIAFDLRAYDRPMAEINRRQDEVSQLSDREIEGRARQLRAQVQGGSGSAEPPRGEP